MSLVGVGVLSAGPLLLLLLVSRRGLRRCWAWLWRTPHRGWEVRHKQDAVFSDTFLKWNMLA